MLTAYDLNGGGLKRREGEPAIGPDTLWIDLLSPTGDEEQLVEGMLKLDIPTKEELHEIEASSRLYQEDGAHFMTATLLIQIDSPRPITTVVTFVLAENRLITIRYAEPYSFQMFTGRALRSQLDCSSAAAVLIGLLEIIIDRHADLIERIQAETDRISRSVFVRDPAGKAQRSTRRFDDILQDIGHEGDLAARAREALLSLNRLVTYFQHISSIAKDDKAIRARIKTAQRDISSLSDHVNALGNQITFLLDAVLGMISIQQNAIIKFFSVVAVIFMPPTLIASIYGMNFKHMPELQWLVGYPFAMLLMVLAAVIPVLWFRFKGWL